MLLPKSYQQTYRSDIDGLRAIAILSVVLFHAFGRHFPGGFIGVDIFFVISGYLISTVIFENALRNRFSFLDFYDRRIRRIFPGLLLVLTVTVIVGWLLLLPDELVALGKEVFGGATFIANFVLWLQSGYFDIEADKKPLLHLWSLSVEEQFYLVWPILLILIRKRKTVFWIISFILPSFFLNLFLLHKYPSETFYFPVTRFWELLIGSLLSQGLELNRLKGSLLSIWPVPSNWTGALAFKCKSLASAIGISLIFGSVFLLDSSGPFPGWRALFPTVGTALLISAGPNSWVAQRILSQRPIVFIGLISYPLYLWHWPILAFLRIENGVDPTAIVKFVAMLLAALLAWVTYLIEAPIRRLSLQSTRAVTSIVLASLVGFLGALGLTLVLSKGEPQRFPSSLVQFVSYHNIDNAAFRDNQCFMNENQGPDDFSPACVEGGDEPLLLLWGDSHAAHLYAGLKALQNSRKFRIAQFTASACPPSLNVDVQYRPFCRSINDAIKYKSQQLKPDIVVLAGFWYNSDIRGTEGTIEFLKQVGVKRIVLFGPVPYWRAPLIRVLLSASDLDPEHHLPHYLDDQYRHPIDESSFRRFAERMGVIYISPIDALCDGKGCLAVDGEDPEDMMASDSSHLSPHASRLLIRLTSDRILGPNIAVVPQ